MMKFKYITFICVFICETVYAQHRVINQFKDFVANADFTCYEQKIQHDLDRFNRWLTDSLPLLTSLSPWYRPCNMDMQKENRIFVLSVTLANTENYRFEDNIYDYLIIDSLRTFIIVCIDEKMNVTGITDTDEPGTFVDLKDDFYYHTKKHRRQIKEILKNINKEKPDLILYCEEWRGAFLYVKEEQIFRYDVKIKKGKEFNEVVRECPDINIIRRSNEMILPYSKGFSKKSEPLLYRFTGCTPHDEVRICPPLSK